MCVGQKRAVEETKAVFAPLRERIGGAVERVEGILVSGVFPWAFGERVRRLICGVVELWCAE